MLKKLWQDEEGLTTVEYALLLLLVAIAAITAWTTLGSRVNSTVTTVNSKMPPPADTQRGPPSPSDTDCPRGSTLFRLKKTLDQVESKPWWGAGVVYPDGLENH